VDGTDLTKGVVEKPFTIADWFAYVSIDQMLGPGVVITDSVQLPRD
jgi:hypothetical protein